VTAAAPAGAVPVAGRVPRFDRLERVVHWCTATLMLILLLTGFSLYAGPLSTLVGRRELVRTIHVYAGLLLPVPVLVGILRRAGGQLRADLGRLSRWSADDRAWWSRRRRAVVQLGKFNPGQKLNAVFLGAAGLVMLGTGVILKWFNLFPVDYRTGATFVHDWFAIGIWLAVGGHVLFALRDPVALGAMLRGSVPARWARLHRPRWYEEETGLPAERPASPKPKRIQHPRWGSLDSDG
jgi:formate dehydrogenase subunit gamma